jgi:hypothetical protein
VALKRKTADRFKAGFATSVYRYLNTKLKQGNWLLFYSNLKTRKLAVIKTRKLAVI